HPPTHSDGAGPAERRDDRTVEGPRLREVAGPQVPAAASRRSTRPELPSAHPGSPDDLGEGECRAEAPWAPSSPVFFASATKRGSERIESNIRSPRNTSNCE